MNELLAPINLAFAVGAILILFPQLGGWLQGLFRAVGLPDKPADYPVPLPPALPPPAPESQYALLTKKMALVERLAPLCATTEEQTALDVMVGAMVRACAEHKPEAD